MLQLRCATQVLSRVKTDGVQQTLKDTQRKLAADVLKAAMPVTDVRWEKTKKNKTRDLRGKTTRDVRG